MRPAGPVEMLHAASRSFGRAAAREKLRLLESISAAPRLSASDLLRLHDTLDFMRAFPDDARVLRRVRQTASSLRERTSGVAGGEDSPVLRDKGFPGSYNSHPYSYGVLKRMVRFFPGCLEIDWEELEDESAFGEMLGLLVTPGEAEILEDARVTYPDWLRQRKHDPAQTDLEFVVELLEGSAIPPQARAVLLEGCDLPVRYRLRTPGTGRCEVWWPPARIHYQRSGIERRRSPVERVIRRPLRTVSRLSPSRGRELVRVCLAALCSRNLEIHPLIHANPADVTVAECGRGLRVVLAGVVPELRSVLESIVFFLVLKNGVPVAYGPAGVCFGCCEMGINLFPEFRGGEIRYVYAQFMRVLHHVLGVDYYYVTRYGMGEDNEEAIRTGAFWFYRKLGFKTTNPKVEALARQEEARMKAEPGYRSDRRMLRRLSHTEVSLDLSSGKRRPIDLGKLALAQSRFLAATGGATGTRLSERAARALGVVDPRRWSEDERRALRNLAPVLCMVPDLARWTQRERAALARAVRAKGDRSEIEAALRFKRHGRFELALRELAV